MATECVSLYGCANAGLRARFLSFADRAGLSYRLWSYFDGNSAGLEQFRRTPGRAVESERRLRKLLTSDPERLFLRREASPLSRGLLEEQLLGHAKHGVYDIDDALFEDVRGRAFEALFSKGATARRAAGAADVVIAGNQYLADWASDLNDDVRVIPTCVDTAAYTRKTSYEIGSAPSLVWLGTASGEGYLDAIAHPLLRLHRETGATLTIIGDATPRLGRLEQVVTRVPWDLGVARRALADHDVGIMPLADTPFERGKCAYKLLEYGAAGLPAVASPVGLNDQLLAESRSAAPQTEDDWYDALRRTITASACERRTAATQLHEIVVRDYDFTGWLSTWRSAVEA